MPAHLGIDEHRRGKPRWMRDPATGEYELLADRWHTCFTDLSGEQGLLGQVEGRTADDAAYWLSLASAAWRERVAGHRAVAEALEDRVLVRLDVAVGPEVEAFEHRVAVLFAEHRTDITREAQPCG